MPALPAPYFCTPRWDAQARVYYSESNVPGLVVEAATRDEFAAVVDEVGLEILRLNVLQPQKRACPRSDP